MIVRLKDGLFDFQEQVVEFLLKKTSSLDTKKTITIKSPTGSGKTIMLISYIDEYLTQENTNTAFIWLCPGQGNLEEQSRSKMIKYAPNRATQNLLEALTNGFIQESTTFINWELVAKSGNIAMKDGERKNLFDRIADAHRLGTNFIIIIDEEHLNNTSKAKTIIDAFSASYIVRVSATAKENKLDEFYEVDEQDVIDEGLITKALYINEGVADNIEIFNDYDYLVELAANKRNEITKAYMDLGKDIRPLVLIQFPNAQPDTITAVEEKLADLGYTYENGMVSKWMSGDKKDLPDNLTENTGEPVFLLMKQAISTGWDCPRAKILVKLREGMTEDFEIQTLGRIRRMPEACHYDIEVLDFCYIYTFDEKFKEGLLANVDRAYIPKRLLLKDKCKTFTLEKENRDLDYQSFDDREVFNQVYEFFKTKYSLGQDKNQNKLLLIDAGYVIDKELIGKTLHGQFVKSASVINAAGDRFIKTRRTVNTTKHRLELRHSIDGIKTRVGIPSQKIRTMLERMFRDNNSSSKKFLTLNSEEFYAFVINNEKRLAGVFKEITSQMVEQRNSLIPHKTSTFKIPEQDFFNYDPSEIDEIAFLSSAYEGYSSAYITEDARKSKSERLFERYCEEKDDIDWIYKNGDTGQQYFSIVYLDATGKQWLFYPDYIVKKLDGTIWIIETKGGEQKNGKSKNIDIQVKNKFAAFKRYASDKKLRWGFVRDKNERLYINNTEYTEDMQSGNWKSLSSEF